jgi:hypothetical protein
MAGVMWSAALAVALVSGCSDDGPKSPDHSTDSGPLSTSLAAGGNSVYPPPHAGKTWPATFGSLLICSPEPVTISGVVPHYKVGKAASIDFLVRVVPELSARAGRAAAWAPVGSATKSPERMADSGQLRYTTLGEARGFEVDQPCQHSPDASFTEILTALTSGPGGAWIDHLDVEYAAVGKPRTLRVDWSYVACGALIDDPDVC